MEAPTHLPARPSAAFIDELPQALLPLVDARRWVIWRWTEPTDGSKPDKPLYRANDPWRYASTQDPASWGSYDSAMNAVAAAEADGAGYVLRDDAAHIFLDLDQCRDPVTGALADWAQRLVEEADSYTEVTPSGRGLRIIGRNESLSAPVHRRVAMPEGGGVEIFHRCPRYVTVSGQRLIGTPDQLRPICDVAADLLLLAQPAAPRSPDGVPATAPAPAPNPDAAGLPEDIAAALTVIPNADVSWDDWSRIGMTTWRASGGSAEGLAAWKAWSAKSRKHSDVACEQRWRHWFRSPPTRLGFASLYRLARQANPLWVKPSLLRVSMGHAAPLVAVQGAVVDWEGEVTVAVSMGSSESGSGATESPGIAPWPEPVNFLRAPLAPIELGSQHLPEPILAFARDTAGRMGTAPVAVALAALIACSAVMSDTWQVQPKQHDPTWLEQPRLWGAIVGPPSVLKSPILRATTAPLDRLEAEAAGHHAADLRRYKADLKRWKAEGSDPETEPRAPRLRRWLIENATVEAISEVLRSDGEARFETPASKLLIRQDELSEWIANLDRYRQGGRGGGDRGSYLRLFNGGRFTIDRVQRGAFAVSNWSACLLGGIQPEVIARIAQQAADDGLLQRFLFTVIEHAPPGEDRAPDHATIQRYRALIPALAAFHPAQGMDGHARHVVLHAEAHRHRHEVEQLARLLAALPNASPRRQAAAGKLPGIFARVALAFHLIEIADRRARGEEHALPVVLQPGTAAMAAAFLRDVAIPHMVAADAIMFNTSGEADAEWIAGFILARGLARLTMRDLVQNRHSFRGPERRNAVLAALRAMVDFAWLSPEPHMPHAEPTAWLVNPRVHERFRQQAENERQRREEIWGNLQRLRATTAWLQEDLP